jgi:hypothetical protein
MIPPLYAVSILQTIELLQELAVILFLLNMAADVTQVLLYLMSLRAKGLQP